MDLDEEELKATRILNGADKSNKKLEIIRSVTNRHFERLDFKDMYDNECSIQESSNIEKSIWVGTNENRMIIKQEDCLEIALYLLNFYKNGELF